MPRSSRNGQQGVSNGLEEEGIQRTGVLEGQHMERGGQGKDAMEVETGRIQASMP
jgi:hypothetical protein